VEVHVAVREGVALLFLAWQATAVMRSCYFSNSSILGVCPTMTSLSYFQSCPFSFSWTESDACARQTVLCCAIFSESRGGCITFPPLFFSLW
jgi:hypothetical protein